MDLSMAPGPIVRSVKPEHFNCDVRWALAKGFRLRDRFFRPEIADVEAKNGRPIILEKILKVGPDGIAGFSTDLWGGVKALKNLFLEPGGPVTQFMLIRTKELAPMFTIIRGGIERPTKSDVKDQGHYLSFTSTTDFPVFVIKPPGDRLIPTPFEIMQAYLCGSPYGIMLARIMGPEDLMSTFSLNREDAEKIKEQYVLSKYYYFPPFLVSESMFYDGGKITNRILTAFAQDTINESISTVYYGAQRYRDGQRFLNDCNGYIYRDVHREGIMSETVSMINEELVRAEEGLREIEKRIEGSASVDYDDACNLGVAYVRAQCRPEALRIIVMLAQKHWSEGWMKLVDEAVTDRLGYETLTPFLRAFFKGMC